MNSCLYECSVMHHRLSPKEHHFRYSIFMFALDLDELDEVAQRVPLFSRNGRNLYAFRDRDHLTLPGRETASTRENLVALLAQHGIQFPTDGRITLITLPRVFGYIFNPVSFYFCHDGAGAPLCAVVEVGNTFGEMKPYLLRDFSSAGEFRLVTPKHFYVSPFSPLDLAFDFKLRIPGEGLEIHIDDREGERPVLLSALTGKRTPLTTGQLAWFTIKYPLLTLRVISLIHWHALLLWAKRLPWHRKSDRPDLQRDVMRPHASLAVKAP
ncbi:MAG: DUF1365 domain-containing protein [Chthoniobacter sp.]|uniref:DUF1365 domain-containing protein n=1 Tax=Chthoniobacter sp. TaxID=2510640 RepID=UPI0032A338EE